MPFEIESEPLYYEDELARREFILSGGVKLTLPRGEMVGRRLNGKGLAGSELTCGEVAADELVASEPA